MSVFMTQLTLTFNSTIPNYRKYTEPSFEQYKADVNAQLQNYIVRTLKSFIYSSGKFRIGYPCRLGTL